MNVFQRECPTGCGRRARAGHLMCGPCWREVPSNIQRDVYRTWRAWWADRGDADKMRAYTEASDAAVGSIR